MTRAEMLLKIVMSPLDPSIVFVEQYVRLVQGKIQIKLIFIYIKHVSLCRHRQYRAVQVVGYEGCQEI